MSRPSILPCASALSILCALAPACGGGSMTPDAAGAPETDAFVPEGIDAGPIDAAAAPHDTGATERDSGVACSPMPGPASTGGYCDLLELAVISEGASHEARLYGRLSPEGGTSCVVVDEVEVLDGGSIGTLAGVGAFVQGTEGALLARGPALEPMVTRCASDEGRFDSYGLLVRGRYDGGSFEARCALAEGGSRWPPALRVTCHENVEAPPRGASTFLMSFMGVTTTQLMVGIPHGPGSAITAVSDSVRVIPHGASGFGAPPAPRPFDAPGFVSSLAESETPTLGTYTSVSLFANTDVFGATLCPVASTMPMPGEPPPPVFLARLTGTSERGAFSSEAYVSYCTRPAL